MGFFRMRPICVSESPRAYAGRVQSTEVKRYRADGSLARRLSAETDP
ncbi:hypothetical protein GCM10023333_18330 [Ferrimonas pelagia]|uniref:Transposase n=1 Tax=Ferrimonas pelagia TaxID=1177826 RepID=A0ABP9ERH0_9GAMM